MRERAPLSVSYVFIRSNGSSLFCLFNETMLSSSIWYAKCVIVISLAATVSIDMFAGQRQPRMAAPNWPTILSTMAMNHRSNNNIAGSHWQSWPLCQRCDRPITDA